MIVSVYRESKYSCWLRAAVLLHLKRYMTVGSGRRSRLLSCSFMNLFHCIYVFFFFVGLFPSFITLTLRLLVQC